jgi:hypothetical protein
VIYPNDMRLCLSNHRSNQSSSLHFRQSVFEKSRRKRMLDDLSILSNEIYNINVNSPHTHNSLSSVRTSVSFCRSVAEKMQRRSRSRNPHFTEKVERFQ